MSVDFRILDLLGEVTGVGMYDDVAKGAVAMELYGYAVQVVSLDLLERAKRAVGRAKDLLDLEVIREIRRKTT